MNFGVTADRYTEFFCEFVDKHFDTLPEPSVAGLRMKDIHDRLRAYSYQPCPHGCGLHVPFIPTVAPQLGAEFRTYYPLYKVSRVRGAGPSKYTNLVRKDCN